MEAMIPKPFKPYVEAKTPSFSSSSSSSSSGHKRKATTPAGQPLPGNLRRLGQGLVHVPQNAPGAQETPAVSGTDPSSVVTPAPEGGDAVDAKQQDADTHT